jgi:hypothetical protein
MVFSRVKLAVFIFLVLIAPAHGQEIEDANCQRVKAAINKLNDQPSFRLIRTQDEGVMEFIQLKEVSYRRWNDGPWIVQPRPVVTIRHGDVDLIRSCWVNPGLNGMQTVLRYERYDEGRIIEFHSWLDNATHAPAKTAARQKGKVRSWVSTFSYERDLAAPTEWQTGLP